MSKLITQSTLTVNGIDLKTPDLIEPPPRTTVGQAPDKLTVACVWWGDLYPQKYVANLKNMVARNLTIPHDFVCITDRDDVPEGVTKISTPSTDEGWWQKVNLFKPGLFNTRVLYFDLDVVITRSINHIASVSEPFCMIENYGPNKRHAAHNSSVMVWTPSVKTGRIYTKFSSDVMKQLHGDQCWIWRVLRNDIYNYPKSWVVSYKYERIPRWKNTDKDTSVVVFHGKPKPHEVNDKHIVDNWK